MGHSSLNPGKLGTPGRGLMAKAPRERVGKQYKGTRRTRNAVHGEGSVELAKWTFPVISLCREPYEVKVSRTGLTGGMGRRTVRQRALCLPSKNIRRNRPVYPPDQNSPLWGGRSQDDHLSSWICFPGLLAGHKDNGRAPTANGEIAMRATLEAARASRQG